MPISIENLCIFKNEKRKFHDKKNAKLIRIDKIWINTRNVIDEYGVD